MPKWVTRRLLVRPRRSLHPNYPERIPPHRLQKYRAGVAFHSRGTTLQTSRDGGLNEISRKYSSTSESSSPHSRVRSSLNCSRRDFSYSDSQPTSFNRPATKAAVGNFLIISISCEDCSPSGPRLIIASLAFKNDNGKDYLCVKLIVIPEKKYKKHLELL